MVVYVETPLLCRNRTKAGREVWLTQPDPIGISCAVTMVNDPRLSETLTLAYREKPHTDASYAELLESERTASDRRYWWIWADDRFVGIIGLYNIGADGWIKKQSAQMYYLVKEHEQRQGIASIAVARVLKFAFEELGLEAVGVDVFANHEVGLVFANSVGFKERFRRPGKYRKNETRIVWRGYIFRPEETSDSD